MPSTVASCFERNLVTIDGVHQCVKRLPRSAIYATPGTHLAGVALSIGRILRVFADDAWSYMSEKVA